MQFIIGVERQDVFAGGDADAGIPCFRQAAVWLFEITEIVFWPALDRLLKNIFGGVGAAVIDDDNFPIRNV